MKWLSANASVVEAIAALITAAIAVLALVGVKYQLDAADDLQRAQSARDAYRSHLVLAVNNPKLASPKDACSLSEGEESAAYSAFVDHLLYSAEQMLEVEPGWETTFSSALEPHAPFLCSPEAPQASSAMLAEFLETFRGDICSKVPACK